MKRVLRWVGYGLAGLAGLVLLTVVGAVGASEAMIRWPVAKPATRMVASADAGAIARGRKIAVIEGCHDCHGAQFEGKLFHDEPAIVRAWAPNLSLAAAHQSDAELDGAIRHGVAADGRRLWIMPSEAFAQLTDQETSDLLAYLRSFRTTGVKQPALQVGPVGRIGLLIGKFQSAPQQVAQARAAVPADAGPQHAAGRSLSRACVECHGQDLKGGRATGAPDLTIAASYDRADFERLLRTGVAAGNRKVGLMSDVAPARFNILSSQEIGWLHEYLKARASREFAAQDAASLPNP
jgi:cytochrome c553